MKQKNAMAPKNINKRIEMLIGYLKLNPYSFSKEIGLSSNSTIARIIKGETTPSYDTLLLICRKYEWLNISWLMIGAGDMKNNNHGSQFDHQKEIETLNLVIKIIYEYPETFNPVNNNYTLEEAITLIASCPSRGNEFQKAYFIIIDSYTAFRKLFALGLRKPAVELGKNLLERSVWYQQYEMAALVSKYLCQHYYLFEDKETALMYNEKFKLYRKIEDLESESEMLYNELIYDTTTTGIINKSYILKSLKGIKSKLELDSCIYKYYYYQCNSLITTGEEHKDWCLKAIAYFENLYFMHEGFLNIFRKNLIRYYNNNGDYEASQSFLDHCFKTVVLYSRSWFILMFYQIDLRIKIDDFPTASKEMDHVLKHPKYIAFNEMEKKEWNSLLILIEQGILKKEDQEQNK